MELVQAAMAHQTLAVSISSRSVKRQVAPRERRELTVHAASFSEPPATNCRRHTGNLASIFARNALYWQIGGMLRRIPAVCRAVGGQ